MPAKSRTTKTSKAMPPPQSTSPTLHETPERRHRHSYSGPSPVSAAVKHAHPVGAAKAGTNDDDHVSATGTDAEHEKKLVSPPGSRISFHKFMYTIAVVALLLLAWWVYGMIVLLEQMKEEVGWWGIIVGDASGRLRDVGWMDGRKSWGSWVWFGNRDGVVDMGGGKAGYVESSLNALADALGIPPVEVAHAVKPLVPSASLASIASKGEETGDVMKVLLEHTTKSEKTKKRTGFTGDEAAEDEVD